MTTDALKLFDHPRNLILDTDIIDVRQNLWHAKQIPDFNMATRFLGSQFSLS